MCVIYMRNAMFTPRDGGIEGETNAVRRVPPTRPERVSPLRIVERPGGDREHLEVVTGDVDPGVTSPATEEASWHGTMEGVSAKGRGIRAGVGLRLRSLRRCVRIRKRWNVEGRHLAR